MLSNFEPFTFAVSHLLGAAESRNAKNSIRPKQSAPYRLLKRHGQVSKGEQSAISGWIQPDMEAMINLGGDALLLSNLDRIGEDLQIE